MNRTMAQRSIPINISKIINGLYISDMNITTETIRTYRIGGILNCTPDVPSRTDVETIRIPVEDSLHMTAQTRMCAYFPVMTAFIHKVRELDKKNVLVHCIQGKQRSATAIVAYLMKYYNLTLDKAVQIVVRKHPIAFNGGRSIHFEHALKCWG